MFSILAIRVSGLPEALDHSVQAGLGSLCKQCGLWRTRAFFFCSWGFETLITVVRHEGTVPT